MQDAHRLTLAQGSHRAEQNESARILAITNVFDESGWKSYWAFATANHVFHAAG
jgi:hypothetical protein